MILSRIALGAAVGFTAPLFFGWMAYLPVTFLSAVPGLGFIGQWYMATGQWAVPLPIITAVIGAVIAALRGVR